VVMDGRDIGTVVLPQADLKIFLDASLDVRAGRRLAELLKRGEATDFEAVKVALHGRDEQDRNRPNAPLLQAEDAVYVDTTELGIEAAVDVVLDLAKTRLS